MKILWFSPVNVSSKLEGEGSTYNGIGWVSSLLNSLRYSNEISLGVLFFTHNNVDPFFEGNVHFFPITKKRLNIIEKLLHYYNLKSNLSEKDIVFKIKYFINEFNPDLIHVFGTETEFSKIVFSLDISVPVIYHLQGLVYPIHFSYFPPGFNLMSVKKCGSFIREHIFRNGISYNYVSFSEKINCEFNNFQKIKFFAGRTHWDQKYSSLLSNNSRYFHVDEILREEFYSSKKWFYQHREKIHLITTISDVAYKGFDLILNTASLLSQKLKIDFEWKVVGLSKDSLIVNTFEKYYNLKSASININLLGVLSPDNLTKQLLDSDFYIHTSYIDNSPNSICESQLLGLPVIACDVGGVSSLIKPNETGVLIPANDPFQLIYHILYLKSNSHVLKIISDNALKDSEYRHNKEKIIYDLLFAYKSISSNVVSQNISNN